MLAVISKFCPLRLPNDHLEFPGSLIFPTRGKKGPWGLGWFRVMSYATGHELAQQSQQSSADTN